MFPQPGQPQPTHPRRRMARQTSAPRIRAPRGQIQPVAGRGIDVSRWQGNVNWAQVRGAGVSYAFIKASEGSRGRDPRFAANWQGARQVGIRRGAYHFFRPEINPLVQAETFVRQFGGDVGELPPVLDVEVNPGLPRQQFTQAVRLWLQRVQQLTGQKPMIYTSASFWDANTTRPGWVNQYPLWVAQWDTDKPTLPSGWSSASIWQFSSRGRVPGIEGDVDLNLGGPLMGALPQSSSGIPIVGLDAGRTRPQRASVRGATSTETGPALEAPNAPGFRSAAAPLIAGAVAASGIGRAPGVMAGAASVAGGAGAKSALTLLNTPAGPISLPFSTGKLINAGAVVVGILIVLIALDGMVKGGFRQVGKATAQLAKVAVTKGA